jgi:hypothetical protein
MSLILEQEKSWLAGQPSAQPVNQDQVTTQVIDEPVEDVPDGIERGQRINFGWVILADLVLWAVIGGMIYAMV